MANMDINALKNNLGAPARDYLWEIIVPTPLGGGEVETFQLRAQSAEIPSREQGAIPIAFKQTAGIMVPGKLSYTHTWACTFIEGEDKKVWEAMYGWQQLIVHNVSGTSVGDAGLKTDMYLTTLKTDGTIAMKIKLRGCYVKTVGAVKLSYGSEGIINYDVTFSFDSVEIS